MNDLLQTMQLFLELLKGAPCGTFFSTIGTLIDAYASENNVSDEEVEKWLKWVIEVRGSVRKETE